MPEALSELLRSPQGAALLKGLKLLLLFFFGITVFLSATRAHAQKTKNNYHLLNFIFWVSAILILCNQTFWQIFGFNHPKFARFLRRYNHRPNAADIQILRGPILDRRGMVMAAPVRGDIWKRRYPLGETGAHPIGYYHSTFGITAVERIEDAALSGYATEEEMKEEPLSKRMLNKRSREGKEIQLTLDARLQMFSYDRFRGKKGAAVVMDPHTGDLLALVSVPGFDPLNPGPAMRDGKNLPAFNRAVQGLYPPGSTFKILIAGMAIDLNSATPQDCPGNGYIFAPHTPAIRDSEFYSYARKGLVWNGWGVIGIDDALVHSSNVYFAKIGVLCGTAAFNSMMVLARVSEKIPYAVGGSGTLKSAASTMPFIENPRLLAQPSIGQGKILVTPLHVACYTAAVAANGMMPTPRLLMDEPEKEKSQIFSKKAAGRIRRAMRQVVVRGTGRGAEIPGLAVCGKTGTAQVSHGEDHAWFTCFAPEHDPAIVVTVLVEHGGFGAAGALPIAREILEQSKKLGYTKRGNRP